LEAVFLRGFVGVLVNNLKLFFWKNMGCVRGGVVGEFGLMKFRSFVSREVQQLPKCLNFLKLLKYLKALETLKKLLKNPKASEEPKSS
jgi:hypothetical protein